MSTLFLACSSPLPLLQIQLHNDSISLWHATILEKATINITHCSEKPPCEYVSSFRAKRFFAPPPLWSRAMFVYFKCLWEYKTSSSSSRPGQTAGVWYHVELKPCQHIENGRVTFRFAPSLQLCGQMNIAAYCTLDTHTIRTLWSAMGLL